MAKYLHLYETTSGFEADYNGEYYHEPWTSLTKQDGDVNYNKKQSDEKYIRIEATQNYESETWDYIVTETNLTCEDLEATGNTYKAYMTIYEYESPDVIECECDLIYDDYSQDYGVVWTPADCDICCRVGCGDGELYAWYEG